MYATKYILSTQIPLSLSNSNYFKMQVTKTLTLARIYTDLIKQLNSRISNRVKVLVYMGTNEDRSSIDTRYGIGQLMYHIRLIYLDKF